MNGQPNQSSKLAYELPDEQRPASAAAPPEQVLDPSAISARHDPYAALRFKDFSFFVLGWVVSVIGQQILEVAVAWDLYQRTGSAMTLGWVGLVTAIPVVLLALPAGHLADLVDRRRIIFIMQLSWCLCAAALGVLSYRHSSLAAIYGMLFLAASSKALGLPARSALAPTLVPQEIFANAVTWNTSGFQIAAMSGPAIGGFILAWSSAAAYYAAAVAGLIFAATLLAITSRPMPRQRQSATLKSVAAGIRFVVDTKIILAIITLDLFAVLLGGATYLLPIFATNILHVGATGYGWLRAAPAVGALLMAILVAHLPPMKNAGRDMLLAVTGFGLATIVFGLSRNFWLSLAMLFLTGAFDNISVLVRHTLVQVLTPDAMRGRVSAVNNIFISASNELGGFESGLTANIFGPLTSVIAGGIGTILVVAAVALHWPQVRRFGSLVQAKPLEERKPEFRNQNGESNQKPE